MYNRKNYITSDLFFYGEKIQTRQHFEKRKCSLPNIQKSNLVEYF